MKASGSAIMANVQLAGVVLAAGVVPAPPGDVRVGREPAAAAGLGVGEQLLQHRQARAVAGNVPVQHNAKFLRA